MLWYWSIISTLMGSQVDNTFANHPKLSNVCKICPRAKNMFVMRVYVSFFKGGISWYYILTMCM